MNYLMAGYTVIWLGIVLFVWKQGRDLHRLEAEAVRLEARMASVKRGDKANAGGY